MKSKLREYYPALILLFIFITIGLTIPFKAAAQNATEIIDRMEEVMRGESSVAEMTMTIERPRYTRDISMKAWSLGEDFSLILITAPARDQGTTYLKRRNEIWNYVPNIDRTIKMPPSMMSQSWMGSDFTNDDLVRESSTVDDYEHRILREEEYNGRDAWVLELIPKPDTPIVYGKVLMWVDKKHYIQLKVENYDQRDELANTIEFSEIGEMGGRTFPAKMTLTPADKPDHQTVMEYRNLEFDVDLSESFFTQQNMRRVR
ncbi:outer membrane lipoprotein-sorting protein [Rhodohalobacter sp. SW132]|uniref:outer membrane lipoprotein-sorting protein n=1 Tax=Rhodohalobacter sp. SW132 TaxID=2293433 RepID=UPI000E25315C|nr:outer membrane lipoprotein-sorting protein [Rhodohalobacter sp. SW132]REL38950.1 outer membrane lipoprotein-sorting protein [Rhodohalobacter sp. SW132]